MAGEAKTWVGRGLGLLGLSSKSGAPLEAKSSGGLSGEATQTTILPKGYYNLFFGVGHMSPHVAMETYYTTAALSRVVDMIAKAVADIVPVIYVNGTRVDDSDIEALLNRPGYNRTRKQFVEEMAIQVLVTGTAFPYLIGNKSRIPNAMDIFPTACVHSQEAGDGYPLQFDVSESSRSFCFKRDARGADYRMLNGNLGEVISIFDTPGRTKGIGLSPLTAIQKDISLNASGLEHNESLMRKGARPSGVLATEADLTRDQQEQAMQSADQKFGGSSNAGSIMVAAGGKWQFTPMSINPKDMDWSNLMRRTDEAIITRYGVPLAFFDSGAQTYDNFRTATENLYTQTVLPLFGTLYDPLGLALSYRVGAEVTFGYEKMDIAPLAARTREVWSGLTKDGIATRNEAREAIGKERVNGGDELYVDNTMVPITLTGGDTQEPDADATDNDQQQAAGDNVTPLRASR